MSYQKKAISIDERQAKSTAWALTFADVVTLLLTFFVLLLVMLNDAEKSINVIIDKLLDQTYEEMIKDLKSDEIMVERETKGIKITLRGNLFKSASSEIDMKYFLDYFLFSSFLVLNTIKNIIKNELIPFMTVMA